MVQAGPGSYQLSEMGQAMSLDRNPARQTAWLRVIEREWTTFLHTEEVLTTGRGVDYHANLADADQRADYQESMLELARRFAPLVAAMVPVRTGAERLLDIGGSHGLYGSLIARNHPPRRSEVLDLPDAVEHASQLAATILHHFTPTEIADLLGDAFPSA